MNTIPILYDDEEIFVINKPAGLAVQGGQGIKHSLDVDFSEQVGHKVYLVHRLDKDTCGLMIVAKNAVAANKWTKLIGSKIAKKEYIALCVGKMHAKSGVIKEKLVQHGQEKSAITNYTVEKQWKKSYLVDDVQKEIDFSQIRLVLETGRMHQIRIHLAKQNCPIAGDDQHGNFKINKLLKKHFKIKRFLLASVRLTIPINGKDMVFEIENPFLEYEIN
jgi:23S rRNA pseudouridine955/2504/2580 synthase